MQARVFWTEKMQFVGECENHSVDMDAKAPIGSSSAPTPKELLAMAAGGCTGMDVVALMRKHKQPLEAFEVSVDAPVVEKVQPPVFKQIQLSFYFKGQLDKDKVIESVALSQSKYCAVSAMLVKSVPIHYKIFLNGEEVHIGEAHFGQ